jgi:Uma2 family endonuclease
MEEPTMGRTMAQGVSKLTYEDLLLFPDDGRRHEIIDGEHFVTPAPHTRHQWVSQNLNRLLDRHVMEHRLGRVYYAPVDIVLSDVDVVQPDLVFISQQRLDIVEAVVRGAPDLVVEIASPGSRRQDEVLKRGLYERAGVQEYWLVDPEAETVKVFRGREGGGYGRPLLLSALEGDRLESPLLPDLQIPLPLVFAE